MLLPNKCSSGTIITAYSWVIAHLWSARWKNSAINVWPCIRIDVDVYTHEHLGKMVAIRSENPSSSLQSGHPEIIDQVDNPNHLNSSQGTAYRNMVATIAHWFAVTIFNQQQLSCDLIRTLKLMLWLLWLNKFSSDLIKQMSGNIIS